MEDPAEAAARTACDPLDSEARRSRHQGLERTLMEFGRYRIVPSKRVVLLEGKPLQLGDRAFDVLMRLLEARGALVAKDDLLKISVARAGR
jgi:DNA-binding response OmpR family regulator